LLAVGETSNLGLYIYDWDGNTLTNGVSPSTILDASPYALSWSPDGQSLAVGGRFSNYLYIYPWTSSPTNCTLKNNWSNNTQAPTSGLGFGVFGSAFADTINNNQAASNAINYGGGVCNIQQGYSSSNFTVSNGTLQNVSTP
jgi:WD40 repeat protein